MALWFQTHKQRSTSRSLALICGPHLEKFSPSVLSLERPCNEFGYSFSWASGGTPRLSKGETVIECRIEKFILMVAVTESIEFSTAKGNLERERTRIRGQQMDLFYPSTEGFQDRDASSSTRTARSHLENEVVEEQSLCEKLPSVVAGAEKRYSGKRNPNVEVCTKTKTTRARCRIKPEKRVDGIAPFCAIQRLDHG